MRPRSCRSPADASRADPGTGVDREGTVAWGALVSTGGRRDSDGLGVGVALQAPRLTANATVTTRSNVAMRPILGPLIPPSFTADTVTQRQQTTRALTPIPVPCSSLLWPDEPVRVSGAPAGASDTSHQARPLQRLTACSALGPSAKAIPARAKAPFQPPGSPVQLIRLPFVTR